MPFSPEVTSATLLGLIQRPEGFVYVAETEDRLVGLIVGYAGLSPWNDCIQAEELLWWVEPSYRGKVGMILLEAFEAWTSLQGAVVVGVSYTGDNLTKLFERKGYARAEAKFYRVN
jgi:hypothetical protein